MRKKNSSGLTDFEKVVLSEHLKKDVCPVGNIKAWSEKTQHLYKWRALIVKEGRAYQVFLFDESPEALEGAISPKFTNFKDLVTFMQKRTSKDNNDKPSFAHCYRWLREAYLSNGAIAW